MATFCALSMALFAAAMADFTKPTAVSEPAGAFLTIESTTEVKVFCRSANCVSATRTNSSLVAVAIS